MKRPRLTKTPKTRRATTPVQSTAAALASIHPAAAGIDVGATELMVAVGLEASPERPVQAFGTTTPELHRLRDWLQACAIRTVAMESTSNYWVAAADVLEAAGIEVWLVNARHVKGVPGRLKTDVADAEWLRRLHTAGLLTRSYRPAAEVRALRYLMRQRADLIRGASQQVQMMQKVLTECNLQLHHVLSDLDGVSGMAILDAILAGERHPAALAKLKDYRCKATQAQLIAALTGNYQAEYLTVLRQAQALYRFHQSQIAELDHELTTLTAKVSGVLQETTSTPTATPTATPTKPLPAAPPSQRRLHKNSPDINIYHEAWRIYGVDLSAIPGISAQTIAICLSELGGPQHLQAHFPSARRFCSWLGLCPDNRISGGRILKAKTRRVASRVAAAFRMAAEATAKSKTALGDYARRMKARLGKPEGIVATAHKLARILYTMITQTQAYDPAQAAQTTPAAQAKLLKNLQTRAATLGLQLVQIQQST